MTTAQTNKIDLCMSDIIQLHFICQLLLAQHLDLKLLIDVWQGATTLLQPFQSHYFRLPFLLGVAPPDLVRLPPVVQ